MRLLVLLAIVPTAVAQPLSKNELETLPLEELSGRLLGEVGAFAIGVDRSNFPYEIRFFSRAYAPPSQYGLCESDWITLRLDFSPGRGTSVESIKTQPRFGAVDSIYHFPARISEERNRRVCSELTDVSQFFPAPDWGSARQVLYYLDYVKGVGIFKGKLHSFECTGACSGIDAQSYIKTIDPANITAVEAIDCPGDLRRGSCYRITLTGSPPGLFPRELRVYGKGYGNNTEVSHVALWVGVTFF
ncbi:hypothetical protein [Chiayiivirga flava]|uniref:Uncharacterized protein n=1 Tax=Chiayiivirga flava TaxID=659595 RepID=A0A7W8D7C5_9GAMM|nr:hypothetical protein [Chiayiivirga flava]MBB5209269.1 hypothetical protein [Chiayiivirga flava]